MAKDKAISQTRGKGSEPARPGSELERFLEDVFQRRWLRPFDWPPFPELEEASPRVDVIDRDKEVLVRAAMPGLDKNDIELEVDGDEARAKLKDGMLEVTLPKAEQATRKRIAVES